MNEMDNDNPIIESLEALLRGEEQEENLSQKHTEQFRICSLFNDSFSLDQSRDSGIAYPSANFARGHLQSMDYSSTPNQSTDDSGFVSESFDAPFHLKPLVKTVSFDGCFIEDDAPTLPFPDVNFTCSQSPWGATGEPAFGILSTALSHGGDLLRKISNPPSSTKEAYELVKYTYMLNKCWDSVCCISKLRCQLSQKPLDSDYSLELKLGYLLDALKSEITKVARDLKSPRLNEIIADLRNTMDLAFSASMNAAGDRKFLKQVQSLTSSLLVALHSELTLKNSSSSPLEDRFRSDKRFQIWNSLA